MKFLICFFVLSVGLAACTNPTQPTDWRQQRFMQSPTNFEDDELLLEQQGWQVWRQYQKYDSRCIAVKPAEGRLWPEFFWHATPVSGGAGFYMLWQEQQTLPYFGFYGTHLLGRIALAWRDGEPVLDINQRDTVLAWSGETLDFSVTTQPQAGSYAGSLTVTGTLDFSGVQQAYAALEQCQQTY
jgi:hypothetical protein